MTLLERNKNCRFSATLLETASRLNLNTCCNLGYLIKETNYEFAATQKREIICHRDSELRNLRMLLSEGDTQIVFEGKNIRNYKM
jgi:hypothetical protein